MPNSNLEFLIVDDSPTIKKQLKKMIKNNFDCEVFDADDAWSALRLIGNHNISLILMDVIMPEIDGFQTVKMIRKNKKAKRIPVIYITGSNPESLDIQKGLEIGGLDFLYKPFTEVELTRMLRLYIRFIERDKEIHTELLEMNEKLSQEIRLRLKAQKDLSVKNADSNAEDKTSSLDIDAIYEFYNNFKNIYDLSKAMYDNYYDLSDEENYNMLNSLKINIKEAGDILNRGLNL